MHDDTKGTEAIVTSLDVVPSAVHARASEVGFLWLELTGRCQLACTHCYADSGPAGTSGTMTTPDWERVIEEAAALGVRMVQFIGGEPILHPDLPVLVERVLKRGMEVEVFSNLVHVSPRLWETFSRPSVRLATSYYSDDPNQHRAVTGRPSHARTRANIAEAVRRGIDLRVGIIDVYEGQRVEQARAELRALGVTDIGTDRLRGIGRGGSADVGELCGHCGDGRAAVLPDGSVSPCVLSRWMTAGNVKRQQLAGILAGQRMRDFTAAIPEPRADCQPEKISCKPKTADGGDCAPAEKPACRPTF